MYISSVASFIPILPFFTRSLLEKTSTACLVLKKNLFHILEKWFNIIWNLKNCRWQSEGKRANKKCDRRLVPEVLGDRSTVELLPNIMLRSSIQSYTNVCTRYYTKLYMCWMLGLIALIAGLDWGLRRLSGFPPRDEGLLNKILWDHISMMLKMVN